MVALPLADPAGGGALLAAVSWVQGTLLGTVATSVAVVAIASIGLGMLTGRVDLRRGVTVSIGCFILFGASSIAAGLQGAARGDGFGAVPYESPPLAAPATPVAISSTPYDPYAGASVP
jgi:type IV secretion system protein VirB2